MDAGWAKGKGAVGMEKEAHSFLEDMQKTAPEWGSSPWLDGVHPVCLVGIVAVGPSGRSKDVWAQGQQSVSDEDPHEASLIPGPVMGRRRRRKQP